MSLVRKTCGCFVDESNGQSRVLTPCRDHAAVQPAGPAVVARLPSGPLADCCQDAFAKVREGAEHLAESGLLYLIDRELERLRATPKPVNPSEGSGMAVWEGDPDAPQG